MYLNQNKQDCIIVGYSTARNSYVEYVYANYSMPVWD